MAGNKLRIELDTAAVGKLLKGADMQDALEAVTGKVVRTLGPDYGNDVKVMDTRAVSSVYTKNKKAVRDNLKNNTLLKAVQR